MSRRRAIVSTALVGTVLAAVLGVGVLGAAREPAAATRPIADFVDAQGTYCIDDGNGGCFLFVPPVANFFAWTDPKRNLSVSIDYAGLVDRYLASIGAPLLGTTTDGTVVERPLRDGRAEVTVTLHTRNALTWVIAGEDNTYDYANAPTLLGARITEVLQDGQAPALGESLLQVKFINTAPGAPLPDLEQLLGDPAAGQEGPSLISFRGRADGELHAVEGVEGWNVAEGTPGRVATSQTGLLGVSLIANPNSRPALDGFPAESIILRAVGH